MQIALRPVAVRALLLVIGVALGLIAFLAAFSAVGSSSSDHSVIGGDGHTVTARGVGWI
jgi:hypothetical protein